MSHQILKNITIIDRTVFFEDKCNNDTEPYRKRSESIPEFLHQALGNVYQFKSQKINAIIAKYEVALHDKYAFWWEVERGGIDSEKVSAENRALFYEACDKIKALGKRSKTTFDADAQEYPTGENYDTREAEAEFRARQDGSSRYM